MNPPPADVSLRLLAFLVILLSQGKKIWGKK
jgi:hypothetical protein